MKGYKLQDRLEMLSMGRFDSDIEDVLYICAYKQLSSLLTNQIFNS